MICLIVGEPALAGERLWPTRLITGDCVSARIYAPRNEFQERLDNDYCVDGNHGSSEKIIACLKNSRTHSAISFFTDRCGNEELPFFISLNGVEYELHLIEKKHSSPVCFSGRYAGQGLEVQIESDRLLRKTYDRASPTAKRELVGEECRVLVTVKKDSHIEKIPGVFWHGR